MKSFYEFSRQVIRNHARNQRFIQDLLKEAQPPMPPGMEQPEEPGQEQPPGPEQQPPGPDGGMPPGPEQQPPGPDGGMPPGPPPGGPGGGPEMPAAPQGGPPQRGSGVAPPVPNPKPGDAEAAKEIAGILPRISDKKTQELVKKALAAVLPADGAEPTPKAPAPPPGPAPGGMAPPQQ